MTESRDKRIVTIVGRPNVGKSATFNRLAGRRISIVHAQSGVTRDRIMREVTWGDERFELIDTGGICRLSRTDSQDVIEAGIHSQVEAALDEAAMAILVVDIEAGLHPMDEEVAAILRGNGCPTIVAVNKADNPERDGSAVDFEKLGFPVFPISALHNRGIGDLMELVVEGLPDVENETETNPMRVAIVGRPNVGKSSYVNRLLRNDRVIVSNVPGTTRDSVDVPFAVGEGAQARHYLLVDTAGIRRLGKVDSSVERFSLFRAENSIRKANVVVLVLDAVAGPTAQDKKVAALVLKHNKGCVILVNKWDLADGKTTQRQYGPAILKRLPFMGHCPVIFASSLSGYNIRRTIEAIDHVAAQVQTDLPTGILNRVILDAHEKVKPQSVGSRRLRIYYSTQVGHDPVRIRLFVNSPKLVRDNYKDYIVRKLREYFGLDGAPIILHFRGKDRKQDAGKGR